MRNWPDIPCFTRKEFDDPRYPGSGDLIHPFTLKKIVNLRMTTGWPIITHNKYGLRGCVCVDPEGHSPESFHYAENGSSAVDFHFKTKAHPREQAYEVLRAGFRGVGLYPDQWRWPKPRSGPGQEILPIGFHVDMRRKPQWWVKRDGSYLYLLP